MSLIGYIENYVKKNERDEERIKNGSVLESPAMIGYFEAKEILELQQENKELHSKIDKAIEYINKHEKDGTLWFVKTTDKLLEILKDSDVNDK